MKLNQWFLLLAGFFGLCFLFSSASIAAPLQIPSINDAANMSYQGLYDNQTVSLSDGQWTGAPFVKGSASRPSVGLIQNFSFTGDIDSNGIQERVVFLWESSGGSGTRVFMAVIGYHSSSKSDKPINLVTHALGDRVQLRKGRAFKGGIELNAIQQGEDDAACCATVKVLRSWSFIADSRKNQLVENKPQLQGRISLADLQDTQWLLTRMNWRETLAENTIITLSFAADRISGNSGCNRFFATLKAGNMAEDITIGQAGGTLMACPKEAMDQESRFLKALEKVNKYSFVNGQLALTWIDGGASSTMLFSASE